MGAGAADGPVASRNTSMYCEYITALLGCCTLTSDEGYLFTARQRSARFMGNKLDSTLFGG